MKENIHGEKSTDGKRTSSVNFLSQSELTHVNQHPHQKNISSSPDPQGSSPFSLLTTGIHLACFQALYTTNGMVSDFFHSTLCLWVILLMVGVCSFSFTLEYIPLYAYSSVYLCILLLMDIWVFGLLFAFWNCHATTALSSVLWSPLCISVAYILRSGIAGQVWIWGCLALVPYAELFSKGPIYTPPSM